MRSHLPLGPFSLAQRSGDTSGLRYQRWGIDEARQQAAQALANARGIPIEEANEQIVQIEQRYQQTVDRVQQRATEAADAAASGVSTGAILAFVALVLGAIAGWLGGRSGVVHPIYADRVIPTRHRL